MNSLNAWRNSRSLCHADEGPVGLIMCPSRELARQTYDVINGYCAALRADGWPELRTMLCIGGVDVRQQTEVLRQVREQLLMAW